MPGLSLISVFVTDQSSLQLEPFCVFSVCIWYHDLPQINQVSSTIFSCKSSSITHFGGWSGGLDGRQLAMKPVTSTVLNIGLPLHWTTKPPNPALDYQTPSLEYQTTALDYQIIALDYQTTALDYQTTAMHDI